MSLLRSLTGALGAVLLATSASGQFEVRGGVFNPIFTGGAPSVGATTTPQFAGQASNAASSNAVTRRDQAGTPLPPSGEYYEQFPAGLIRDGVTVTGGIVLVNSSVGGNFASGVPRFSLGDVIPPPLDGIATVEDVEPSYWRSRPVVHEEEFVNPGSTVPVEANPAPPETPSFYYSPHADAAFASEAGRVEVVWVTAQPVAADGTLDGPGPKEFRFLKETFSVASSTNRPSRRIYWTENQFNGPLVNIPEASVAEVNIVYTQRFPEIVDFPQAFDFNPENPPDELPPVVTPENPLDPPGTLPLQVRTLWYNQLDRSIHAYNLEGRVFIEFLGDLDANGVTREHLGFEIVDVIQEARPETLRVNIGEQVLPVEASERTPETDAYSANIIAGSGQDPYIYEHVSLGGSQRDLYAIRETSPVTSSVDLNGDGAVNELDNRQSNEVLIYWTESGLRDLQWPREYVGYIFQWPDRFQENLNPDEDRLRELYALYARDAAVSDHLSTGVQLSSTGNPVLVYQDDPTQQHAEITPQNVFVTIPGQGNRSLIRFTNGDEIWFQRVYSQPSEDFNNHGVNENATVGVRIEAPAVASGSTPVGYIREESGTLYNVGAYRNPFAVGFEAAAQGAIIPVNSLPGDNNLEVWWYQAIQPPAGTSFAPPLFPSHVRTYEVSYPTPAPVDAIVMARNDGSRELGIASSGTIYRQPNPAMPGYNPNEEHAVMIGGVAYALRDDLNLPTSSPPFVLIDYTAEDGRPAMVTRAVRRELNVGDVPAGEEITFSYQAPVGVIVQAPNPLPFLPLPRLENPVSDSNGNLRNVANFEVEISTDLPPGFDPTSIQGSTYEFYERFTYTDRKGATWIFRGPHAEGINVGTVNDASKSFSMRYFYVHQAEFDYPIVADTPTLGVHTPYLRPLVDENDPGQGYLDRPLDIEFIPTWPANPPVLNVAETLGLPKRGLPAVRGQTSARLLYQQSIAADLDAAVESATLFDPTRAKTYPFVAGVLESLPASIQTDSFRGKTFFPQLPPHLSQRLFFDPNIGELGALVFQGEFFDAPLGEDFFFLNVMSDQDIADAQNLVTDGDEKEAAWDTAITSLSTTLETFIEDPSRRGIYIPDPTQNISRSSAQLAKVETDEVAVDSYALSAVGGGTGFVTMITGNGRAFTPEAEPVAMQVFRVAAPLNRGELKVVNSSNPLDEKLTLRHSADFAGNPEDYDFAWITAQPVDGLPPILYNFAAQEVLPNGPPRSWSILNNPSAGYEAARNFNFNESSFTNIGNLSSGSIVINDGEGTDNNLPQAILRETLVWNDDAPLELFLTMSIANNDGAAVYLNGSEIAVWNVPGRTNTVTTTLSPAITLSAGPLSFRVSPEILQEQNTITVDLYTTSDAGATSSFDLRLDGLDETADLSGWQAYTTGAKAEIGEQGVIQQVIEGSSIFTLTDNYFTLRYRARPGTDAALATGGDATTPGEWSRWMNPQLAEGWIKRALGGINPFEQRVTDLLNNDVNTDVSLLTQAGTRFEGDIALSLANIDDFGLIEIYETILRRGQDLSINGAPALNVPAANDALLLAAGYLNDLYVLLGNEAFADAANPTIAFSTDSGVFGTSAQFGELNTSLFSFKGQLASVLDEELALLRGRDDRFQPAIDTAPVYNRLVWNFTGGIDAGEAVYALNYNIQDQNADGATNATDAARQYPQGHGDGYGHYLTALKGYYSLLKNPNFGWVPRIEAVSVLGQPVNVDYQDERKFTQSAASVTRTANQILGLTYRQQFNASENAGWSDLKDGSFNQRTGRTRYWGTDEWASRAGQGAFFHWVTANSILPEEDTNPDHVGIQVVDRTTVPELNELVLQAKNIQDTLEQADARLNPLGLAKGALSFDISPSQIDDGKTHFEQVYERAVSALQNAEFAFNNAKDTTELLRRQDDSLDERRFAIAQEELAFENKLIELYGTPYPDDIGPGRTYAQGYAGPDLLHYRYVDSVELFFKPGDNYPALPDGTLTEVTIPLDPGFQEENPTILNYDTNADGEVDASDDIPQISFSLSARGEFVRPTSWTGSRAHPGELQAAVSDLLLARIEYRQAADDYIDILGCMTDLLQVYQAKVNARNEAALLTGSANTAIDQTEAGILAATIIGRTLKQAAETINNLSEAVAELFPKTNGFSNDFTSTLRGSTRIVGLGVSEALSIAGSASESVADGLGLQVNRLQRQLEVDLENTAWAAENRQLIRDLLNEMFVFQDQRAVVDTAARAYDQAERKVRTLEARGQRLQAEREVFRKRSAAIVQGNRTRDFAFRSFRNEALEKYQTLFNLAARYSYLAATAYDYETGLLDSAGNSSAATFFNDIVQSRAIGVTDEEGNPQFSSSSTGDPGLAGILARLDGDWSIVKTRLGFNNPDRYRTGFSLREELHRIIPQEAGDTAWRDVLRRGVMSNILDDQDVRRYCLQVANQDGSAVPGIVLSFSTTIGDGVNFFGQPLAGGDHGFSPSSFATKIRASGVAFKGYRGLDSPTSTGGLIDSIGGTSPPDPGLGFLDQQSLSATPHIYLIPTGVDMMRSPPLGDTSTVRGWTVQDQAIPLPFNIGNSDFSTNPDFTSTDSLSEAPFMIRKHQAFRAVPSGTVFSSAPGFTNSRLIGRSVWNSRWKIVIPGKTLLANPNQGLRTFLDTVTDIELFLETYSYSGN